MTQATVAVINNDPVFLELMRELLTEEGYQAVIWRTGSDAYAMVQRQPPAVIVLDIRLDGQQSGLDLLAQLRADPRTRPIPIILCSADRRLLDDHRTLCQQGVDVLPKPFDLDDLLAKVAAAIGARPLDPLVSQPDA